MCASADQATRVVEYRSPSTASQAAAIAENICEAVQNGSRVTFIGDPEDVHGALLELHNSGFEGTSVS